MALEGCRILVVEDDFFVGLDLDEGLRAYGAEVVGPAASVAEALDLITRDRRVDLALLDLNLRNETVHPILTVLERQKAPCLLLTGDRAALDDRRLAGIPLVWKPATGDEVAARLADLWQTIQDGGR